MSKRSNTDTGFARELAAFYQHFFPSKDLWELFGNPRRELAYTYESSAVSRHHAYKTLADWQRDLANKSPWKVDFGAVFAKAPGSGQKVAEHELLVDIDVTDYDDIRTCCKEADFCAECWKLVDLAVAVVDRMLRDDFGYEHLLWVFSGRRGVHCWVCDPAVRQLDVLSRNAVADYLALARMQPEIEAAFPTIQCLSTTNPLDLFPRIDAAVTRQPNHLLKSPFCVHPATGYVCVPFDPSAPFDPRSAPTLQQVVRSDGEVLEPYLAVLREFAAGVALAPPPPDPLVLDCDIY